MALKYMQVSHTDRRQFFTKVINKQRKREREEEAGKQKEAVGHLRMPSIAWVVKEVEGTEINDSNRGSSTSGIHCSSLPCSI